MTKSLLWLSKAAAIWIALLAATVAAGTVVTLPGGGPGDGPLSGGQAFLAVNGFFALVLAGIGARLQGTVGRKWLVLFALFYGAGTLLAHVEALFFGSFLELPSGLLLGLHIIDAVRACAGALAAAALWRRADAPQPEARGVAWKLPAIALAYILVYFAAGYVVAWQSAAIRAFYADGFTLDLPLLVLLQAARGALWAGLALLAVRALTGSALGKGFWTGAAFSLFMAAPLLYPTAVMPWAVRQVHLVEVGLSNFLFGFVAAALLAWAGRRRNKAALPGSMPRGAAGAG